MRKTRVEESSDYIGTALWRNYPLSERRIDSTSGEAPRFAPPLPSPIFHAVTSVARLGQTRRSAPTEKGDRGWVEDLVNPEECDSHLGGDGHMAFARQAIDLDRTGYRSGASMMFVIVLGVFCHCPLSPGTIKINSITNRSACAEVLACLRGRAYDAISEEATVRKRRGQSPIHRHLWRN